MTASPLDTKAKASAGHMETFFAGLEASLDAQVQGFFLSSRFRAMAGLGLQGAWCLEFEQCILGYFDL